MNSFWTSSHTANEYINVNLLTFELMILDAVIELAETGWNSDSSEGESEQDDEKSDQKKRKIAFVNYDIYRKKKKRKKIRYLWAIF